MKVILVFVSFIFGIHLTAQTANPNYDLLWEISGKDLVEKSYVFGSAHLNDHRAFVFPDSLYHALDACDAFANEINFDSLAGDFFQDLINKSDDESDEDDESSNDVFKNFDYEGQETLLDLYLYSIARKMNKSIHGLEKVDDQMNMFSTMRPSEYTDSTWNVGGSNYEAFMNVYEKGNLKLMNDLITSLDFSEGNFEEDFQMVERNHIQANSIVKLGKQQPTFSVVGAGHLVGKENVLDLLLAEGYKVRNVKFTNRDDRLESIYQQPDPELQWHKVEGKIFPYEMVSFNANPPTVIPGTGEMHMDFRMDQGLMYFVITNQSGQASKEEVISKLQDGFMGDNFEIISEKKIPVEKGECYQYGYKSDGIGGKVRVTFVDQMVVMQFVMGFSEKALANPLVDQYFEGLKIIERSNDWQSQTSEEGAFSFYLPDVGDFKVNEVAYPDDPEKLQRIYFKIFTDTEDEEIYIVRYHHLPPGMLFTNDEVDLMTTFEHMVNNFNAEVASFEYFQEAEMMGLNMTAEDASGKKYFLKGYIRGTRMYLFLQGTALEKRNNDFFEKINFSPLAESEEMAPLQYEKAAFSATLPSKVKSSQYVEDDVPVQQFDMAYESLCASLMLQFYEFDPYVVLDLSDTAFTVEKLGFEESVDSLYLFERFKYKDVGPAHRSIYSKPDASTLYAQMDIYLNHHLLSALLIFPPELYGSGIVDDIFSTLEMKLLDEAGTSLSSDKSDKIFKNLQSSDPVIQEAAKVALEEYTLFEYQHVDVLMSLLEQPLIDEDSLYNAKYYVVRQLHDFEGEQVEDALVTHFKRTDNEFTKDIILESLSKRNSPTCIDHFFEAMNTLTSDYELVNNIYRSFDDSLALYLHHYDELKILADKDVAPRQFLSTVIDWELSDSTLMKVEEDVNWYEDHVAALISEHKEYSLNEPDATISPAVMDYFIVNQMSKHEQPLYEFFLLNGDVYGNYRIAYNLLGQGKPVPESLLKKVIESDPYYYYWILNKYHTSGRMSTVSADLKKISTFAPMVMTQYYYDQDVYLEDCAFIKEVTFPELSNFEPMAFGRCPTKVDGEFYYGLVGPFDNEGGFNFDNDASVYYNDPKLSDDEDSALQSIKEYIVSKYQE